ncbi:MAG: efflux RND transporter periplasmic adaptor subunit [Thermodesulfovibrionales bacterium]|nr:efflux RND transporter periplasmic adaptor subunit [Thermodesulfovibrionales bacterium]
MGNAKDDISKLKIERKRLSIDHKKHKKIIYALIILSIIIIFVALYLGGILTPAIKVETTVVSKMYPSQLYTLMNASGYIVPQRKAAVASKLTGRLIALTVEEGSKVKKGEIIGRLENKDAIALLDQAYANLKVAEFNLKQAEAELHEATVIYKRNQELIINGYISQAEFDASEARYKKALAMKTSAEAAIESAKATVEVSKLNVEYTLIRAPFDGVVLTKNADIGDIVTPIGAAANAKSALVTMADMDSLLAEVDVAESNLKQIKIGQPCEVQLDAIPERRFSGIVHMIVPTADRSKASVLVKVKLLEKDNRILPEMSVKVAFLSKQISEDEREPLTVINTSAIFELNGKKFVYSIKDNRAILSEIKTGKTIGEMSEVISGLKVGDLVVLSPITKIKDRTRVKISEK